ncbi:MAG: hypothetical protein ACLQNE_10685, partial [Thermoguttaceae bacterium]
MTRRSACSARKKAGKPPHSKMLLFPPRSQALPGNALLARLRLLLREVRWRECRRSLRALRSQAEPGNEGSDEPTGVGRGAGRPSVSQPRLPLQPDKPNHSEIWLDWLDHELRQAVGSIFGLSFYMIGHPAIGPILSL